MTNKPKPAGGDGAGNGGASGNGSRPRARRANGNGSAPAQVRRRRDQFLIASRQAPGITPLAATGMVNLLNNIPDIEIVKEIEAPVRMGLQSLGDMGAELAGVVIAKMEPQKATALQRSGQTSFHVERDEHLIYGIDPHVLPAAIGNPGVVVTDSSGFEARFEIRGPDGPLGGAEVHVFGSLFPGMGFTDDSGKVVIEMPGETADRVRSIYVKPKSGHWDFWITNPEVVEGEVNPILLRPLTMPEGSGSRGPLGWGQKAMGLDQLPSEFDGSGIRIAVIDSGAAQGTHRNLGAVGPGRNMIEGGPDDWTEDKIGHGSHCACVIAGRSGEAGGIAGFAPAAEVHILRVFPGGRFSDLISALNYCVENSVDVVSMSLGGGASNAILTERIAHARSLGIACIVAAGNSASPVQFPANLPTTLAVGAIGRFGEFPEDSFHSQQVLEGYTGRTGYFPAGFSCFGPEIDVCAPGVAVLSAVPPDDFAAWDGTSMATPHVAGLAALVLGHHPAFQGPSAPSGAARVQQLFDVIRASCIALPFGAQRVGRGLPFAPAALGRTDRVATSSTLDGVPPESLAALLKLVRMMQGA